MTPAEAIARDERRAARDAWKRAGGYQRRPLHSFSTADERAEKRAALQAERVAAREYVATAEGAANLERVRELNPHLSELNAAIVAHRLPGYVIGTASYWRRQGARVLKGEAAALYIGGGPHVKYAPVAAFAACQTSAAEVFAAIEDPEPVQAGSDDIPF